ncbi:MAG: DNA mismatch repair endonuclease MutL [Clostridia bacterium]|nr:DNA mismatch repair endonuclease MutL [Clostridia bacterium]
MAIKILDPSVVGRIAAGEVVERPASVAKELIENSIDAGATAITIEIRGGGIEYLRVTDNGCGIEPGQVAIAFENHATSKLRNAEELDDIRTLGFRGEALPSIAAVSHIEMTTRRKDAASGVKLQIDGGIKRPVTDVGCPEGTTVVVRELFYNVPVRRTFLKKPNYEGSLVNDLVARMILGNPQVSFRFINNSKTVYHSFGDGNLQHAVFAVYGSETAEKMIAVDAACGGMRICGMIGVGELSKATRAHQSFYINGRTVRCALMTQVLEQICKGRVTIGTYPMCALTLTIPPASVDVNVHPNKLEVRFRDEVSIRLSAENILSQAFVNDTVLDFEKKAPEPVKQHITVEHRTVTDTKAPLAEPEEKTVAVQFKPVETEIKAPTENIGNKAEVRNSATVKPMELGRKMELREESVRDNVPSLEEMVKRIKAKEQENAQKLDTQEKTVSERTARKVPEEKPVQMSMDDVSEKPIKPKYKVIGVVFNTYILVEIEDAMVMIDQHAAHERLMYEKFTKRLERGETAAQNLLIPIIVDVTPRELALILDNQEELARAGYDVEQFGDRKVSIRSVPFIMGSAEARPAFMDILGSLDRIGTAAKESRADEIAVMACKAAVKAGDRLTDSEIESLIIQMQQTGASPTCPHGRPVSKTLTRRDIEKLFKRIQ